jgi:hypothetical protein
LNGLAVTHQFDPDLRRINMALWKKNRRKFSPFQFGVFGGVCDEFM